jgi:hypothetical protein
MTKTLEHAEFISGIGDIQLIRPGDSENYGLNILFISPPEHNELLADAMNILSRVEKPIKITMLLEMEEDE